jgi:hypothetical protein
VITASKFSLLATQVSDAFANRGRDSIVRFTAVGKSALLTRFSENVLLSNYTSTIGIDFNSRMIRVEVPHFC